MNEEHTGCKLVKSDSCKEKNNISVCAFVRKDNKCLRKLRGKQMTQEKETKFDAEEFINKLLKEKAIKEIKTDCDNDLIELANKVMELKTTIRNNENELKYLYQNIENCIYTRDYEIKNINNNV